MTGVSGLIHRLLSAPRRLACSRGFGVHSPFAYAFVREVIHPDYRYYAHSQLDDIARAAGVDRPFLYLAFRMACHLRVSSAAAFGRSATAVGQALRLADSEMLINVAEVPTLVVADRSSDATSLEDAAAKCLAAKGSFLLADIDCQGSPAAALWTNMIEKSAYGMGFTNGRIGVFIARKGLPRCDYEVWM